MRPALTVGLHRLGAVLSLLGVAFVVWRAAHLLRSASWSQPWTTLALHGAAALAIYLVAGLLLGVAWHLVCRACGLRWPTLSSSLRSHLRAQAAKYIPGNVFHFVSRHADARGEGGSHADLIAAGIAESVLLVLVAGLWICLLGKEDWPVSAQAFAPWRFALPAVALAGLTGLVWQTRGGHNGILWTGWWVGALTCYGSFFLLLGFSFTVLVPAAASVLLHCVAITALAWLAGFVVPGSPGGLGVRESVLVLTAAPMFGEAPSLAAALSLRLVTMSGDIILSGLGHRLPMPPRAQPH